MFILNNQYYSEPVVATDASAISYYSVGDFNADGHLDVVGTQADWPSGTVSSPITVWYGSATGVFTPVQTFSGEKILSQFGAFFEIADFNGDGVDDIYLATYGDELAASGEPDVVLLSTANGDLIRSTSVDLAQSMSWSHGSSIGDLDGDGDIDIFQSGVGGTERGVVTAGSRILLNDGSGNFSLANHLLPDELADKISYDVVSSKIADINNDGLNDLIIGHDAGHVPVDHGDYISYEPTGSQGSIFLQSSDGDFVKSHRLPFGSFESFNTDTVDIDVYDIDQNGHLDIMLSSYNGGWVRDGNDIRPIFDGNFSDDPEVDAAFQWRDLQLIMNYGEGDLRDETHRIEASGNGLGVSRYLSEASFADINADGYIDIFANVSANVASSEGKDIIWLNNGRGQFIPADTLGDISDAGINSAYVPFIIDMDGDSDLDIGFAASSPIPGVEAGGYGFVLLENNSQIGFQGSSEDDLIIGGDFSDVISGEHGNDILRGGPSSDIISGGMGDDVLLGGDDRLDQGQGDAAVFSGAMSEYTITGGREYCIVTSSDGSRDKLFGFDTIIFDDQTIGLKSGSALDGAGKPEDFTTAERVVLLYEAALDRDGNIDLPGLNFYIDVTERDDLSDEFLAADLMTSPEFTASFGNVATMTNASFLEQIYLNVLDRPSDSAGREFYLDLLNDGVISKALALSDIAISPENTVESVDILMDLVGSSSGDWNFL